MMMVESDGETIVKTGEDGARRNILVVNNFCRTTWIAGAPEIQLWLFPMSLLKGEFTVFFIRELDVPPLRESNLMGPKNPWK